MKESRCFEFIIYDEELLKKCEVLCNSNNYNYAYILHDKDIYEDIEKDEDVNVLHSPGELKKSHWHFILYFVNRRTLNSIGDLFGIPQNMIKIKDNMKKAVEYLIHKNHPDKYRYSVSDVVGPLKSYLEDKTSERSDLIKILSYIDDLNDVVWFKGLVNYCLKENIWASFRRNISIICRYIDEHNLKYSRNMLK